MKLPLSFIIELFCQPNKKPFGSADIAEPIRVLVLNHLANQLGAMPAEPGYHFVNVFNREHDTQVAERVHRCSTVVRDSGRGKKSRNLEPAVTIGGNHHSNLYALSAQSRNATSPFTFDYESPFELQSYFREKRDGIIEGFNHDANIVHS
jgi:hypothetical protein